MLSLGSAKCCHIILLFLTAFTLLINCQQVDLIGPSLSSGRLYYCVDEELVFKCNGSGLGIQWTVRSLFSSQGFLATDTPPLSLSIPGGEATLWLQETTPTLVTNLTIRNVPDITVECLTDVVGSMNTLSLTSSTIPNQVQDLIFDTLGDPVEQLVNGRRYNANISWTPVLGTFDFKQYRVQLCINDMCMNISNTTRTSMEIVLDILDDDIVYALVSTESQCGDVGAPSSSSVILKIVSQDNRAAIITLGVVSVVSVVLAIFLLVACIKYYRDAKIVRSGPTKEKLDTTKMEQMQE